MSIINHKRINNIKSLDLRVELRQKIIFLKHTFCRLDELIEVADKSRMRVLNAQGLYRSGAMTKWKHKLENDRNKIDEIKSDLPINTKCLEKLNHCQLELVLSKVYDLQVRVCLLYTSPSPRDS